jgi:hypothetical protein
MDNGYKVAKSHTLRVVTTQRAGTSVRPPRITTWEEANQANKEWYVGATLTVVPHHFLNTMKQL